MLKISKGKYRVLRGYMGEFFDLVMVVKGRFFVGVIFKLRFEGWVELVR